MQTLTCAFLQAARPFTVHPQLTVEVLFPELREPNISSVVGQRAATEISIKRCSKKRQSRQKLRYIEWREDCICFPFLKLRKHIYPSTASFWLGGPHIHRGHLYLNKWGVHDGVISFDSQRRVLWIAHASKVWLKSHFLWSHPVLGAPIKYWSWYSRESKHFRMSFHGLRWQLVRFNKYGGGGQGEEHISPLTEMEMPVREWQAEIKRWAREKRNGGDKNTPCSCTLLSSYRN